MDRIVVFGEVKTEKGTKLIYSGFGLEETVLPEMESAIIDEAVEATRQAFIDRCEYYGNKFLGIVRVERCKGGGIRLDDSPDLDSMVLDEKKRLKETESSIPEFEGVTKERRAKYDEVADRLGKLKKNISEV